MNPTARTSRLRGALTLGAKLLLALVSGYLTLVLLAVILPRVLPARLFDYANATGLPTGFRVAHPTIGYAFVPNFHGTFDGRSDLVVDLATNSDGWRDEEFAPPDADVPRRVLVIGDSITMGAGVPAEERYSERLEPLLGAEVDNASGIGYELNQLVPLAAALLPRTRPDLVIYGVCQNDIRVADIDSLRAVDDQNRQQQVRWALQLRALKRLFVNVLQLRRATTTVSRTGIMRFEEKILERWEDPAERQAFEARLVELQQEVEASGAHLALVVFPYTFQFDRPADHPYRRPQRYLAEMAARHQLPLLDLHDALESPREPLYLTGDNCHPNAAGNAVAAAEIASWVSAERLLP